MPVLGRDEFVCFSPPNDILRNIGCLTRRERYFTASAKCPVYVRLVQAASPTTDARRLNPDTCRPSVTVCPSGVQQLHRVVHKHCGRIKGGGTRWPSMKDNNWFSVSQLPSTRLCASRPKCHRRASAVLQRQAIHRPRRRREVECRRVRRRCRQQTLLSVSISDSALPGTRPSII